MGRFFYLWRSKAGKRALRAHEEMFLPGRERHHFPLRTAPKALQWKDDALR